MVYEPKMRLVKISWEIYEFKQCRYMETVTYSPCKTIVSSISTFLFEAVLRTAVRERFEHMMSGASGVGFIFKTEDRLPTETTRITVQS